MPDLSYWGGNVTPQGDYQGLEGLAGAGKQFIDRQGRVMDEHRLAATDFLENQANRIERGEGFWDSLPSLEEVQAAPDPELDDMMTGQRGNEVLGQVLDAVTPLGAAGTIMRATKEHAIAAAQKMKAAGAHPQEIIQKTKVYEDRAGNWKTQVPDHNSMVAEHEATRLKRMTPKDINALKRKPEIRRLDTVFRHPELAAEHPQVFKYGEVKYTTDVQIGAMSPKFDTEGNLIKFQILVNPAGVRKHAERLGTDYNEALRSILLHETNHGIQVIDNLPAGNNTGWIDELHMDYNIYETHLKELKRTYAQLPKTAPRAEEIRREMLATEDHLKLLDKANASGMDDEVLYRSNIGEGDAFWTEAMRNDPDVATKLPSHARPERPATKMYGNDLPLMEGFENVTAPGRHIFQLSPEGAAAAGPNLRASPGLTKAINEARAKRRGVKQALAAKQNPEISLKSLDYHGEAPKGLKGLTQRVLSENKGDARAAGQVKRWLEMYDNGLISEGELQRALNRMTKASKEFNQGRRLGAL